MYDIVTTTRDGPLAAFGPLNPVANINEDMASDRTPWVDAEATVLYFSSNRDGHFDIYRSDRNGGAFAPPQNVGELNGPSHEEAPVLGADGLTIFFSSDRDGGQGSNDVWIATRTDAENGFGTAAPVAEVNSVAYDWPSWVSPDGCRLYLASRRNDGGQFDLFVAERM